MSKKTKKNSVSVDKRDMRIRELEMEFERAKLLLDLIPHYVYTTDSSSMLHYWNRATAEALQIQEYDGEAINFLEVAQNPSEAEAIHISTRESIQYGKPSVRENKQLELPDGRLLVLDMYDIPYSDPTTGRKMLLGLATDRSAEHELQRVRSERARVAHEISLAKGIQHDLLPTHCLKEKGMATQGWSRASSETGGDFYDWFIDDKGIWHLVIGDVTGHGLGPALVAATSQAFARAVLMENGPLHERMSVLNRHLASTLRHGMFVTFAVCSIDPQDPTTARFLSAGHGPCFAWTDANSGVVELSSHGLPLGVFEDAVYERATEITINEGGGVLMASDGISECPNQEGKMLGVDPIVTAIFENSESLDSIFDAVRFAAKKHAEGHSQADDMTLVGLGRGDTKI